MIVTPVQAALKARQQSEALRDFVDRAARDGQRIDTVERELFRQRLGPGHSLLSASIAQQGDGDLGPQVETPDGPVARRLPEWHDRRCVSISGELTIARVASGSRGGQRIERVPLDERLGWPEGDFAYGLEDRSPRLCLKGPFTGAGRSPEMLPGPEPGGRTSGPMSRAVAGYAPAFRGAWPRPPPEQEGPRRVVTADGKGGPMRRPPQEGPKPHHRRTKGRRRTRSRWPASGRSTPSSRPCGRRMTSRMRCSEAGGPGIAPSRSTSTSGPR